MYQWSNFVGRAITKKKVITEFVISEREKNVKEILLIHLDKYLI